jgi:hypothetical protein
MMLGHAARLGLLSFVMVKKGWNYIKEQDKIRISFESWTTSN